MRKLPVGFRFDPTNEELLCYYLQRKVKGKQLPLDVVPECNIYGDNEPWKVFDENSKESFYVFTKLKKKSQLRIERKAGCGTWVGKQTNEIEDNSGNHIGFDKYFVFEDKKGSKTNGHWVMHEFSLPNEEFHEYVICEIRNKDSTDKDKALVKDSKHLINTSDEKLVRATKSHVKTQSNGSQGSKKTKLNPGQKNQQQKKKQITSTMDNIDVENRKDNGDPSFHPSNQISEPTPIKNLEPASSPSFNYIANQLKEEDIMYSYVPPWNPNYTEPAPAQYMIPTSSYYENYTAYEFGNTYMMKPYLPQSSLNLEPVTTGLEYKPMMLEFDLETREALEVAMESYWDNRQLAMQVSENMLSTPTGVTISGFPAPMQVSENMLPTPTDVTISGCLNGNFQT